VFSVPPPRIGKPGKDDRERLTARVRHGISRQQRRAASVNMRAQRGFDLARATDAQCHSATRATPEIAAPVQPTIRGAPVGEPTHDNARRAVPERHAAEGEALARHERAGESVEIGRAGHVRHISKLSANYHQIISKLSLK
jgi:hypothetical protein